MRESEYRFPVKSNLKYMYEIGIRKCMHGTIKFLLNPCTRSTNMNEKAYDVHLTR